MSAHTPKKWTLHDPDQQHRSFGHRDKRIMVLHPDGERLIACCSTGTTSKDGSIPREERLANARLIAAAPELLEALAACLDMLDHAYPQKQWGAQKSARAAIAKATGATHEKNSQPATDVAQ